MYIDSRITSHRLSFIFKFTAVLPPDKVLLYHGYISHSTIRKIRQARLTRNRCGFKLIK